MNSKLLAAAALAAYVAVGFAGSSSVIAATVNCPGTVLNLTDREFQIDTSPASSCLATGSGNINGNGDAINLLGYTLLDKSDDPGNLFEGALTITGVGGLTGTFSISGIVGYTSLVLGFKSGFAQINPTWAAFKLGSGVTQGTWTITNFQQSLSHVNLYGIKDEGPSPDPVPLPAPLLLLLSGLGGLGLLGRMRRKTA